MDDQPYAPTQTRQDEDASTLTKTSPLQTALGCGSLLLMVCLPLVAIGWYELSYREWIRQLDVKAKAFDGDVYTGRRDASSHFMIASHAHTTGDTDVAKIVSLGEECLSGGATKLYIDLSSTKISDESVGRFADLSRLDSLDLSDTLVTLSGAASLRAKMPSTEIKH